MRKILLLLVIPIFLFTTGFVLFSSRPTSVSSLCASCTPGDPSDIMCEDLENGGAAWCSYTDDIDPGNTVTVASHSDTLSCTEKGSNAWVFTLDCGNGQSNAKIYTSVGNKTKLYAQYYVNVTLDSTDSGTYIQILNFRNTSVGVTAQLWVWNNGGTLTFKAQFSTTVDYEAVTGPTLSTNTWYRVALDLEINTVNGGSLWVDGTEYAMSSGETTVNNGVHQIYYGPLSNVFCASADEMTWEVDLIESDDDTMPGACP